MLELFQAGTWLRARTAMVRLGYASCARPPCAVRYQVRMAPNAMDFAVPGSCSASLLEWGAFGLSTFSESHAAARIRAAQRPNARGALLIGLIVIELLRRLVRGVKS